MSNFNQEPQFVSCLIFNNVMHYLVASILLLLSLLVLYPLFYKYIPSMLKRVGLGLLFALSISLYYIILFACRKYFHLSTTSYQALVIPQILYGISCFFNFSNILRVHNSLVITWNEGINGCLLYVSLGIGYIIAINGKYPFKCENDIICQSLYYIIFKSLTIVFIIILFLVLAKCYWLQVRENEVNIHFIAEEHHERYIKQE